MSCFLPVLCSLFLASHHPYTDPAMPMKAHGRHIGDIGGKPYVAHQPTMTVEGASGQRYPVYIYPQTAVDP